MFFSQKLCLGFGRALMAGDIELIGHHWCIANSWNLCKRQKFLLSKKRWELRTEVWGMTTFTWKILGDQLSWFAQDIGVSWDRGLLAKWDDGLPYKWQNKRQQKRVGRSNWKAKVHSIVSQTLRQLEHPGGVNSYESHRLRRALQAFRAHFNQVVVAKANL